MSLTATNGELNLRSHAPSFSLRRLINTSSSLLGCISFDAVFLFPLSRSCRARLIQHNARRRKRDPLDTSGNASSGRRQQRRMVLALPNSDSSGDAMHGGVGAGGAGAGGGNGSGDLSNSGMPLVSTPPRACRGGLLPSCLSARIEGWWAGLGLLG